MEVGMVNHVAQRSSTILSTIEQSYHGLRYALAFPAKQLLVFTCFS